MFEVDLLIIAIRRQDYPFIFIVPYLKDKDGSVIYDEDGKPILHTDGTGYISEDLVMKCSKGLHAANHKTDTSFEVCNLIFLLLNFFSSCHKGKLAVWHTSVMHLHLSLICDA